ncbi:hypothetical protein, partial [Salmonella enterica]|uniref:hypothetical protein n=1 Tax=Salmonella enterica TaxID=28901 RepID=UPI001BAE74B0
PILEQIDSINPEVVIRIEKALKALIGDKEIIHRIIPEPISVARVSYRLINKKMVAKSTKTPNMMVNIYHILIY